MKNGIAGSRPGKHAVLPSSITKEDDEEETRAAELERLQRILVQTLQGSGYSPTDSRRTDTSSHNSAGRTLIVGVKDALNREVLAHDYVRITLKAGHVWDAEDLCRMPIFVHAHAQFWAVYEVAQALKKKAMHASERCADDAEYLTARIRWYVTVLRRIALSVNDENSAPGSRVECFSAIHCLTGKDDDETSKSEAMLEFARRHPQCADAATV